MMIRDSGLLFGPSLYVQDDVMRDAKWS